MPGLSELAVILLIVGLLIVVPRIRTAAVGLVNESALGAKELERIQASHKVETCKSAVVNEVFATFKRRLRLRVPTLRALVVHRPGLNACALPDGTVVLWAGLVEAVDRGLIPKEELAGLVAHEIAHIELGHGRQRVLSELMARPLVGRLGSSLGGPLGGLVLGRGVDLARKGASREAELEADHTALELLTRAGFPPEGLERFLGRLADQAPRQPEWAAWLSTHPHLDQRRAKLREQAGSARHQGRDPRVPGRGS